MDQFLFTVMDFGREEPLLMKVDYVEAEGLMLPAMRRYAPSNWEGEVADDAAWVLEICEEIRFDNGFRKSLFERP